MDEFVFLLKCLKLEPAAVVSDLTGRTSTATSAEGMSRFPVLPPIKTNASELEEVAAAKERLERHQKLYQELQKHSRKNVERQHLQMSLYGFYSCVFRAFIIGCSES